VLKEDLRSIEKRVW